LIYRKQERYLYGFVEGKDDPCFYRHLIEKDLPKQWSIKLIPSGSRDKVLRTYQSFDWNNYSSTRICFFVDRDMHDFLSTPFEARSNIYVTDGYSIENSILEDERLLNSVLSDIYQIDLLNPDDDNKIKQIVQENKDIFFEAILPLMGQVLLWRRLGSKANLSNLKLDHIFSFSEAIFVSNTRNVLLEVASRQIGCALCDDNYLVAAEGEIRSYAKLIVRGKYVLWFFIKQCEAIWEAIPKLLSRFSDKPKKRTECGLNNAMVIVAPRARIPESLKEFVEQNYLAFINVRNNVSVQPNNSNVSDS